MLTDIPQCLCIEKYRALWEELSVLGEKHERLDEARAFENETTRHVWSMSRIALGSPDSSFTLFTYLAVLSRPSRSRIGGSSSPS